MRARWRSCRQGADLVTVSMPILPPRRTTSCGDRMHGIAKSQGNSVRNRPILSPMAAHASLPQRPGVLASARPTGGLFSLGRAMPASAGGPRVRPASVIGEVQLMPMQDRAGGRGTGQVRDRGRGQGRGQGRGRGCGAGPRGAGRMRGRRQGDGREQVETGDICASSKVEDRRHRAQHRVSTPLSEEIARLRVELERLETGADLAPAK